jgi:SAM-dependent methyltransferase
MDALIDTLKAPIRRVRKAWRIHQEMRSGRDALLASSALSDSEKALLRKISLRVHRSDDMYTPGQGRAYLAVGLSALQCIKAALSHACRAEPRTILDFPSGYGRVTRFLQAEFREAYIVCAELNREAVAFMSKTGVTAVVSNEDFRKVSFPGMTFNEDFRKVSFPGMTFDLIFSGSLLTHIDEPRAIELLRLYYRSLAPGGLCVFTMHGSTSVEWLRRDQVTYDLPEELRIKLLADLERDGFSYAKLPQYENYGISLSNYETMLRLAEQAGDWTLSSYHERAWARHHDVYAFIKGQSREPLIARAVDPAPVKCKYEWPELY